MLALITTLLLSVPPADTARLIDPKNVTAPPIQISLNNGGDFLPGGLVNVRVQTADDGYLIVFRVDGDGRVRVLFPLDPDADAFVRGGKEYELRGRADRSTFQADDRGGSGMVYAALAHQPLQLRDFTQNGHWDYNALRLRDSSTDAENDLTALVGQMTGRVRFDYDALGYRVQDVSGVVGTAGVEPNVGYYPGLYDPYYNPRWRCAGCGWGYPGSDVAIGFGYSPFWDPWLYSPWSYSYGTYGYGYGYGYGWNPPIYGHVTPRQPLPPGTRSRPRAPNMPPSAVGAPASGRSAPPPVQPPSAVGSRSRPRPADMASVPGRASASERPVVFRQPRDQGGAVVPAPTSSRPRSEPQQESRPVYREPPQQYRAPQPPPPPPSSPPRSSAPPAQHSSPPPAPPPASRSRPGGGGH